MKIKYYQNRQVVIRRIKKSLGVSSETITLKELAEIISGRIQTQSTRIVLSETFPNGKTNFASADIRTKNTLKDVSNARLSGASFFRKLEELCVVTGLISPCYPIGKPIIPGAICFPVRQEWLSAAEILGEVCPEAKLTKLAHDKEN